MKTDSSAAPSAVPRRAFQFDLSKWGPFVALIVLFVVASFGRRFCAAGCTQQPQAWFRSLILWRLVKARLDAIS